MSSLDHRVPPPFVALVLLPVMWLLAHALPRLQASWQVRLTAALCVAFLGLAFSLAGAIAFRRAKTTVNPLRPEGATAFVTTGIYQVTRNPMDVGLMLLLLAWTIWLASPVSLAGPILFMAYITRFQIQPEERVLAAKFGPAFQSYKSRVRRWL